MQRETVKGLGQRVARGADAVEATEQALCEGAVSPLRGVAEGLAMAGQRAASLAWDDERAVDGVRALPTSCVHHRVLDEHVLGGPGAFELLAGSAQDAVDQALVAHRMSRALGRPGTCSVPRDIAENLHLVRMPEAGALAPLIADVPAAAAADPVSLLALAHDAFTAVGATLGRSLDVVVRTGPEQPEILLVAAGASTARAERAARELNGAGVRTALLTVHLVRPFPLAEVRARALDAGVVVVLDGPAGAEHLLHHVREALVGTAAEPPIGLGSEDGEMALRSILAPHLPAAAAEALTTHFPLPAGSIRVVPSGPWGLRTAGRLARLLAVSGDLVLGPDLDDRDGAIVLPCDGEALAGRDLLVASHPALLDPWGCLAHLPAEAVVVTLADATDPAGFVAQLSPAQRAVLVQKQIRVAWTPRPAEDPRKRVPGERASALVTGAVLALLAGPDAVKAARTALDTELPGPAGAWLVEGAQALQVVEPAALAESPAPGETDFRARPEGPFLPDPPETVDAVWSDRIRAWHLHGRGALGVAGPPPGLPFRSAASLALPAPTEWPLVLLEDAGRVTARPFGALLDEGIEALRATGRDARILADNRRWVFAAAGEALAACALDTPLRDVLDAVATRLPGRLGLAREPAAELAADLRALSTVLPADAAMLDLRPGTTARLYEAVVVGAWEARRRDIERQLRPLREALSDLLLLERRAHPEVGTMAAALGAGATGHIDAAAFARLHGQPRGGRPLSDERAARITRALATLDGWLEGHDGITQPVFLRRRGARHDGAPAGAVEHPDPLPAALGVYEGLARRVADVVRAIRTAHLETADRYDPALHDASLAALDWEGFTADELALVPPVVAWIAGSDLRGRDQAALSALLRSSRPVHVVVTERVEDDERPGTFHVGAGTLVLAHREAFAVQATLARPTRLVDALDRMAHALRPAVALVAVPTAEPAGWRALRAWAALEGRGWPELVWDPDAGPSLADRLDLGGNPAPEAAWPVHELHVRDADGGEEVLSLPFTWVDAVALEPTWAHHLHALPTEGWSDVLQPLDTWLERFDPEATERTVPFVWVVDDDGTLQRAVITRALALACRDRLRAWHHLQEIGGYDNAYVRDAAESARREAEQAADARVAALEAEHDAALDEAREEATRTSLERLAANLLEVDGALDLPRPAASPAPRPAAKAEAPAEAPEPEPAEEEEEEEEPVLLADPYIDSPLCTTCNDCTNLNPQLFKYNADKQAYIADPSAGTFAELVKAAEVCPALCIHPGRPRPGDTTATPELIERASKFS